MLHQSIFCLLHSYRRNKHCLLLATILFTCILSHAQSTSLGIAAGLNLPTITGDLKHTGIFPSFHIGFAIRKPLTNKLDFNSGIIFSGQGYEVTDRPSNPQSLTKGRFYYFNAPATIDIKLNEVFAFRVGPQFSLLANANEWTENNFKVNSTPTLRPYDLSIITGIRFQISSQFQIAAQYNWGLLNTSDGNDNELYYPNRVIQVGVSYFFKSIKTETNE